MLSLTDLVCTVFRIPKGVAGDSDVLMILCISAGVIWMSHKVWEGLFGPERTPAGQVSSLALRARPHADPAEADLDALFSVQPARPAASNP